jgi:hypothetical protein
MGVEITMGRHRATASEPMPYDSSELCTENRVWGAFPHFCGDVAEGYRFIRHPFQEG